MLTGHPSGRRSNNRRNHRNGRRRKNGPLTQILQVVKMRGTAHSRAKHAIELTPLGVMLTPMLKWGAANDKTNRWGPEMYELDKNRRTTHGSNSKLSNTTTLREIKCIHGNSNHHDSTNANVRNGRSLHFCYLSRCSGNYPSLRSDRSRCIKHPIHRLSFIRNTWWHRGAIQQHYIRRQPQLCLKLSYSEHYTF